MTIDRIEVITSVARRRRWSAAEKLQLVAAMDEPGAVVTEIARLAEVNASLLYRWRRSAFVPVQVAAPSKRRGPASMGVCTPPSPSSSPPLARSLDHDRVRRTRSGNE